MSSDAVKAFLARQNAEKVRQKGSQISIQCITGDLFYNVTIRMPLCVVHTITSEFQKVEAKFLFKYLVRPI